MARHLHAGFAGADDQHALSIDRHARPSNCTAAEATDCAPMPMRGLGPGLRPARSAA